MTTNILIVTYHKINILKVIVTIVNHRVKPSGLL